MSDVDYRDDVNYIKWMWKSNREPFNSEEEEEWTMYSPLIIAIINRAHLDHASHVRINDDYIIDLDKMMQINIRDRNRQRPVKQYFHHNVENQINDQPQPCPIELNSLKQGIENRNTSQDSIYSHGPKFIMEWLIKFTKGTLEVKFDNIYFALITGIQWEGKMAKEKQETIEDIIHELEATRKEVQNKREQKRIEHLSMCCVKQYTKQCFLYKVVNETLRNDKKDKLDTIGPVAYLIFNFVGHRADDDHSLRYRLLQLFRPSETLFLHLYRGDYIKKDIFDQYQKSVGQSNKYFQWSCFMSTSRDRNIAEKFVKNVLYVIRLSRATSHDQFSDLKGISVFVEENEVLLRPGTRFHIKQITIGSSCQPHIVTIEIVPSFISILQ